MNQEQIAEACRKAIEVLRRDGWNRGALTWRNPLDTPYLAGSHCIGGAVNLAGRRCDEWSETLTPLYKAIRKAIETQYPEYENDGPAVSVDQYSKLIWFIASWNNLDETTEDDVIAILEKVAAG